ncbi:MAG: sigma-54 dependent transcriptional regulator [SAR324 cluster bacterium]|nr:sigma-54 dependent transcriptional regulator [SAR324 cluster bacterium]
MKSLLMLTPFLEPLEALKKTAGAEFNVTSVTDFGSCVEKAQKARFDLIFVEIASLPVDSEELLAPSAFQYIYKQLRQQFLTVPIVILGEVSQTKNLVQAVRAGADRYLVTPLELPSLQLVISALQEKAMVQSELEYLRHNLWDDAKLGVTKTHSPIMQKLFSEIHSVAATDSSVLLLGESGVGKGVLSKLIHRNSPRAKAPFVHVHCGAIPENLIESELFGHEKGAFTGASARKLGRFEIAKGGTIFLDEIGTITLATQTKLLQVLQDHVLIRVGGEDMIDTDVRVISATNSDLLAMSQEGTFREDLYYRLNVIPMTVPSLRERLEDIPILANNFISRLEGKYQKRLTGIEPKVIQALQAYDFPGNIRELENILERAYVLEKGNQLNMASLPLDLAPDVRRVQYGFGPDETLAEVRSRTVEEIEKAYLHQLLATKKGKIQNTAAAAGIGERQLRILMRRHDLKKESYKD